MTDSVNTEGLGADVGPYRLVERIGQGGFGTVYKARQEQPVKRLVALKMIKLGMDTEQIIARFEAERRALAMMDHPGIARVYDVGTASTGRPYFAMELVSGKPLLQFCNASQLSIEERLGLFVDTCQAIQHAHQKGIIHRDLKPSNILVSTIDGRPVAKIIDFGIAKATQRNSPDFASLTMQGQIFGTPAYMSPEQAELREDIDTRSDIYSLGMVLYELLVGALPFEEALLRKRDWASWTQAIAEFDFPSPSATFRSLTETTRRQVAECSRSSPAALERIIKGDLDWIVLKALEKDRKRRYETTNDLRTDVERYLKKLPVTASPPGVSYLVSKFVQRNRMAIAVASLIALLLASGIGMMIRQAGLDAQADLEALVSARREAQLAQMSEVAGRRDLGLQAVRRAMQIQPSADLRRDAIGCLRLLDMQSEPGLSWEGFPPGTRAVAFDRDLQHYARCHGDGVISTFKVGSTDALRSFAEPIAGVERMLYSPNGAMLGIWSRVGDRGYLNVWNIESQEVIAALSTGTQPGVFDFSSDSRWIAYEADQDHHVIEVRSLEHRGVVYRKLLDRRPFRVLFQPEGRHLAIQSDESLKLSFLDWRTGDLTSVYFAALLEDLAWHPAGHLLCVACKDDPVYLCVKGSDGRFTHKERLRSDTVAVENVAFSADGSFLAMADGSGLLQLWDPYAGQEIVQVQARGNLDSLQISQDNQTVAYSRDGSTLSLWTLFPDIEVYSLKRELASQHRATKSCFDSTGRLLFVGSDQGVRVWDWRNRRHLGIVSLGGVHSLAYNATEEQLIVSGDAGMMRIQIGWRAEEHRDRLEIGTIRLYEVPPPTASLALSNDGRLLAALSGNKIRTFESNRYPILSEVDTASQEAEMALHPDGKMLAIIASQELQVMSQQAEGWAPIAKISVDGGNAVAFSARGNYLIAAADSAHHIYQVNSWELLARIPGSVLGVSRHSIASDPSETFAALSIDADEFALVRLSDMQEVARFPIAVNTLVTGLAFSPSGRELAVTYLNQIAEVWDLGAIADQLDRLDLNWKPEFPNGVPTGQEPSIVWEGSGNIFEARKRSKWVDRERKVADPTASDLDKAWALNGLSEYALAEPLFRKVLQDDSNHTGALASLSLCLVKQNRVAEAIATWQRRLKLLEDDHPATVWLAILYLAGPDRIENEQAGHALVERLGKLPKIKDPRGVYFSKFAEAASLYRKRRYREAITMIEDAIHAGEQVGFLMSGLTYLLAINYHQLGDVANAEKAFFEATQLWRKDPAKHANHAVHLALRNEAETVFIAKTAEIKR